MSSVLGKVIIADTSCLIVLQRMGELDLLHRVFGTITITADVLREFGQEVPEWVKVESPVDGASLTALMNELDLGEATAIALAEQMGNCLLVLDDLAARKVALARDLPFIGTLGVFTRAKAVGVIEAVLPFKQRLIDSGFRSSERLINDWLLENDEAGPED